MPELPEVETIRRGLAPIMERAVFKLIRLNRRDLRFSFPRNFVKRLEGARVLSLKRRGKYLLAPLSTGETLIMHLGMTGRFTIREAKGPGSGRRRAGPAAREKHDHVAFFLTNGAGPGGGEIVYNDARRFGFMDLAASDSLENSKHFAAMGPEPFGPGFTAEGFSESLKKRSTPIKAALLDQRVVAGIGNIYACEALFRAGVSPRRKASSVAGVRAGRLRSELITILKEAIAAGGSTLRDFAAADGELGYFQHDFQVYDRKGEACTHCAAAIRRLEQAGRSTFYCPVCQR